jgi:hypothetical protein
MNINVKTMMKRSLKMKMNILKKRNIKVKLKRIRHVFAITRISRNIEKNMKVKIKKIHNTSA